MPKISVIVPVYKVEQYLRRCVDSVLAQTLEDFELILVDDGSPDHSGEICEEYAAKDSRVRVIHKKNGGLSDARNAGIDVAKGDWLFFCDSDDVIHKDCLRILLCSLERAQAQIAVGAFQRFSGDMPTENYTTVWNETYTTVSSEQAMAMMFDPWAHTHNTVSACCKLFPRAMFDDVRFPVGRLFEDEFTVHKLYAKASKVALAEITLYFYYSNDESITGKLTLEQWIDEYDARYERMIFFEEHGFEKLYEQSLTEYLRWAQWDLIKCRKGNEAVALSKKQHFEQQFRDVFLRAKKRRIINIAEHLDYYMLAKPHLKLWWRIQRKLSVKSR